MKRIDDKDKPKWGDVMVVGKYYQVKYRFNGKEFEDGGVFKELRHGNLYFKCSNGDWIIVKPFDLISATTS
jgi:hypothetical protein